MTLKQIHISLQEKYSLSILLKNPICFKITVINFKLCFTFAILLLVFFMFYDCFLFFHYSSTVFCCIKQVLFSKSLHSFFLTIIIIQISSLCITSLPAQFYCIALFNYFLNHVGEKKLQTKQFYFLFCICLSITVFFIFFMWI